MMRKKDTWLAVAGLGLLVFVGARIGWGAVKTAIENARVVLVIIVGLSLGRLLLQTCAWSIALRSDGIKASPGQLMLIRLASQGAGYLSVLGPVASEPMKIRLLRSAGVATTATLVDTGVYWFASGVVAIPGCLAAVLLFTHNRHFTSSLAMVVLLLTAGLFLLARPKLLLGPLADSLGSRCPRWLEKGKRIEVAIREFQRQSPSSIRHMFLLDFACQALLAAEVVALLWCLKIPLHAATVLAIEGAGRAIKIIAGWMPARLGADESGFATAFSAFGLSPATGLTLALARRSRDLLAALIGMSWLAWSAGSIRTEEPKCKPC